MRAPQVRRVQRPTGRRVKEGELADGAAPNLRMGRHLPAGLLLVHEAATGARTRREVRHGMPHGLPVPSAAHEGMALREETAIRMHDAPHRPVRTPCRGGGGGGGGGGVMSRGQNWQLFLPIPPHAPPHTPHVQEKEVRLASCYT